MTDFVAETVLDPLTVWGLRSLTPLDVAVISSAVDLSGGPAAAVEPVGDGAGGALTLSPQTLEQVSRWVYARGADLEDTLVEAAGPVVAAAIIARVGEEWAAEAEAVADLAVAASCATLVPVCAALRNGPVPVSSGPLGAEFTAVVCSAQSVWLV